MGWKPPSAPLHDDLGEIPGMRGLSEEEEKNLEKNAPDRDGRATLAKKLSEREEKIAESLINDYGQVVMDIGDMLDEWMYDEQPAVPFTILSDAFQSDVHLHLKSINSSYNVNDVSDIAYRRTLKPNMFYFGINLDDTIPSGFCVTVTNIAKWHIQKDIDDSELSDYVIPDFLTKLQASIYEAPDMSPSQVRRELVKNGFTERHEVAGL